MRPVVGVTACPAVITEDQLALMHQAVPDCYLAEIIVNSLHHQAVARLAPGLRVAGRAPDGVIEAIEDPAARFTVGLQWHPEMLGTQHPSSAVFAGFGEAVSAAVSAAAR